MQVVAADVGNSSVKYVAGQRLPGRSAWGRLWPRSEQLSPQTLATWCPRLAEPAAWFVSSVNDGNLRLLRQRCDQAGCVRSWHVLRHREIPLTVDLPEPDRVGIDRLLAALAVHRRHAAGQDAIVIDCGTALTIDLVDRNGVFRGGVIMAGPATNLMALRTMTEALPDLSAVPLLRPSSILGRNTREAMLSGAWYSGWGAIQEVVREMTRLMPGTPAVIGTGGGLGPWRQDLPAHWQLVDDLVLAGIFEVVSELAGEFANEPD
jgi:pantothenate kinase type III